MSTETSSVRVQDDLYHYVNGEWLKTAVIPADKPMTGGFVLLNDDVEKLLMADFTRVAGGEEKPDLPILEDAVRLYKKAMDTDARGKAGMEPLYPLLRELKSVAAVKDFNERIADLFWARAVFPFELEVMEDWIWGRAEPTKIA